MGEALLEGRAAVFEAENRISAIEEEMQANGSDFGLATLQGKS